MRIAYLDCFAGVSGDMFLGALIDAGVDPAVLHQAIGALGIGASLRIEKVDRSGITATKVHVLEGDRLAEGGSFGGEQSSHSHAHSHAHSHGHKAHSHAEAGASATHHTEADPDAPGEQHDHHRPTQQQPRTQHLHKGGHHHHHDGEHSHAVAESPAPAGSEAKHEHHHGRSLTVIRALIGDAPLQAPVKAFAIRTFELLGASEAKIHNVPVDEIHFHEVGAVDAIVDIVAASAGIVALGQGALAETGEALRWYSSPLNVGGGMVDCAHGRFPVPAPATADLLRGVPTYSADLKKELVTPTGAALIRALAPSFDTQPPMRVSSIGYGAGTRNPEGFPNVLRLMIGEGEPSGKATGNNAAGATETVSVIETAIDDLSPQVLAYVTERALEMGALDVMSSPVVMKKGRVGTLLTVLADNAHAPALQRLLLQETSTLGVRTREERRSCLDRTHVPVETAYGPIRIKIGSLGGQELNAAPEFEDCRAAAKAHSAPVKIVMQAAIAAYAMGKAAE